MKKRYIKPEVSKVRLFPHGILEASDHGALRMQSRENQPDRFWDDDDE